MDRNEKTYSDEFKKKCILELLDGKPLNEVAASNNLAPESHGNHWQEENGDRAPKKAQSL